MNASTLIVIAILLMIEAVKRFFEPQEIESSLVIWLSVLGITFNGLSVWILKNDADKSINMKSAYIHLLTDMLASVAVLVGGLLMLWYKIYWIDSVLTFVISIYLLFVGYDLLRKSTRMLMLFTPDHLDIKEDRKRSTQDDNGEKVHHIHVWCLNDDELQFRSPS